MSRLRHRGHKKTHEKKVHKATGGETATGNPSVLKMARGHTIGTIHGDGASTHLGEARGGKAGRKHRARGGADLNPYTSAGGPHERGKGGKCMSRGGSAYEQKETVLPHEAHGGHIHHVKHPASHKEHKRGRK